MESLLIGAVLDGTYSSLNQQLKANTIDFARRRWGRVITAYSPLLCCAPVVETVPAELVYLATEPRGGLIESQSVLSAMAAFMAVDGRASISNLPGEPRQWLPAAAGNPALYGEAVQIIRASSPALAYLFDEIVEFVVPLGGGRNRGFSTHLARGAIFRALPEGNDRYDVAIDLVHEMGHQVLFAWQSIDPILNSPHRAPVFSQIRQSDRPAIQTYHATVALAFMRFLERQLASDLGMQAAAARRGASYTVSLSRSLDLSIGSVRQACLPTELGAALLDEMEALI